ncbi:MAG: SpoIIE family protein phosphatase [Gemmataceae bacterium]
MASLTVLKRTQPEGIKKFKEGDQIDLSNREVVLGRDNGCDIVFTPAAVSRSHAKISRRGDGWFVEDMESRNKTYVNDEMLKPFVPVVLSDKDKIRICDNIFIFNDANRRPPIPDYLAPPVPENDVPETSDPSTVATFTPDASDLLQTQDSQKLKFLLSVTSELTQTLDLETLLPQFVDKLFEVFRQADRCFVIFCDQEGDTLMPLVTRTRRDNDDSPRFSRTIVRNCLRTGKAYLTEDAGADAEVNLSQSITDYRIRSVMCVPLQAPRSERKFGVIQHDTQDRAKKFTTEDLKLLMNVASQAAIALDNANMHQDRVARAALVRDLELAHQVQLSFLPKQLPKIEGYEFYAYYDSALEVGGDYYDFVPLPGGKMGVMLGDVAGKGVSAALLMAKVSSDARFSLLTQKDLAEAVSQLNEYCQDAGEIDKFVTLGGIVLDPREHCATIVNAGHLPPVLYRHATGEMAEAVDREIAGLPLGVVAPYSYEQATVTLEPGDCLVMFSDGVTEAPRSDDESTQFDMPGVYAALKPGPFTARAMGDRLVKAVRDYSQGQKQHDDITVVSLSRTFE